MELVLKASHSDLQLQVLTLLTSVLHEITTCLLSSLRLLPPVLQKHSLLLLTIAVPVKAEMKNLSILSPALLNSRILELQEN